MRTVRAVLVFACLMLGLTLAGCGPAPRGAAVAPVAQLPRTIVPQSYKLDLTVDPKAEEFSARAEIDVVLKERGRKLYLHGAGLRVSSVYLLTAEGAKVRARYREVLNSGVAQVDLERAAGPGAAKLVFQYSARFNENLVGLYRVQQGADWYAMTQFEPTDARRMFPGFDEPAFKTPFTISITAPAGQVAISNAQEKTKETLSGGMVRHEFWPTPPLPTYLIALAVGPYDVVQGPAVPASDVRRTPLPLRGIAVKGKGQQLAYSLSRVAPVVSALETYFGTPYPFSKIDVLAAPAFSFGAMENAGLMVFSEPLLLLDEQAGASRKREYTLTMVHELAHQWFGNLVTPRWWDDVWLNEAFATWMEVKIAGQVDPGGDYSRDIQREGLRAMRLDALLNVRRVREPVTRTEDAEDAFDPITYQKGAAILAMFERYLGADAFRAGVRRHLERFANDSATTDDFLTSLAEGANRPEVVPAFKSFIDRQGVPVVSAAPACADSVAGPQISMRQSRYAPMGSRITLGEPWIVPACFASLSPQGRRETCALLDRLQQSVQAPNCPTAILPNVGGQAYYRIGLNADSAAALLKLRGALSAGEMLSLTDSIDAAFRAGAVDSALYLEGMRAAAASPAWDVATYPSGLGARRGNRGAMEALVNGAAPDARAQFAALMRAMYMPRLESAMMGGDVSSALLRRAGVEAVAVQGEDPLLRKDLSDRVLPVLGFPAPESGALPLDEDLRQAALTVAIQDGGKPVLDAVFIALKTNQDQAFRQDAIEAIGRTRDQALIAQILRGAVEEPLSGIESYDLMAALLANPDAQSLAWAWLKKNYSVFAQRIPAFAKAEAPWMARWFCSSDMADDVERFFQKSSGYGPSARVLAMSVESVRLCAAFKNARGAELRAALIAATSPADVGASAQRPAAPAPVAPAKPNAPPKPKSGGEAAPAQ
jgi:aminopeptidase N